MKDNPIWILDQSIYMSTLGAIVKDWIFVMCVRRVTPMCFGSSMRLDCYIFLFLVNITRYQYLSIDKGLEFQFDISETTCNKTSLFTDICVIDILIYLLILIPALGINHALGRPAYQSSTLKAAELAVDGDVVSSAGTKHDLYSYWVVDLQKDVWVSSVALTNRDNICEL